MTAATTTAVLIVNYRTAALTVDCLRSLAPQVAERPGTRVLVGDADSPDDSLPVISAAIRREGWAPWAEVVALGRNGGFAWGNNELIRRALAWSPRPTLLWLLNPDTVARPGALAALVDFMDATPAAAVAGSRLENPDGSPQVAAFRFPSLASELESSMNIGVVSKPLSFARVSLPAYDSPTRVDWVSGASLMMRSEVVDRVGVLDDRYFMYFEELDLCRRAAGLGYRAWFVPQSRVVHLVGQASGIRAGRGKRRPAYWYNSRRWFWVKNHGRVVAALADVLRIVGTASCRLALWARRQPNWMPPHYLRDLVTHSVFLRGFRP